MDGMFAGEPDQQALARMRVWHTADMATDIINTNTKICPRLDYVRRDVDRVEE